MTYVFELMGFRRLAREMFKVKASTIYQQHITVIMKKTLIITASALIISAFTSYANEVNSDSNENPKSEAVSTASYETVVENLHTGAIRKLERDTAAFIQSETEYSMKYLVAVKRATYPRGNRYYAHYTVSGNLFKQSN